MTFRYARAGVFRCDTEGCEEQILSPTGDLPKGWEQRAVEVPSIFVGVSVDVITQHACPACRKRSAA